MRVVVLLATTGTVLFDSTRRQFEEMRGWQFREFFTRHIVKEYSFGWLFLVGVDLVDETLYLHYYAASGDKDIKEVTVQAMRRDPIPINLAENHCLMALVAKGDRAQVWEWMQYR